MKLFFVVLFLKYKIQSYQVIKNSSVILFRGLNVASRPENNYRELLMKYGREGGVESYWRPYSVGVYILSAVTGFKTYKIACPPQDKNLEGEGASSR
jgi:hypothetical protein